LLDYPILLVLTIFIATTIFYIILYRRVVSRAPRQRVPEPYEVGEVEVSRLRDVIPRGGSELEKLLSELKEIRRRAELLLDEGGGFEGEGGGDKRGPEGD
jgi:hypothetical protein